MSLYYDFDLVFLEKKTYKVVKESGSSSNVVGDL